MDSVDRGNRIDGVVPCVGVTGCDIFYAGGAMVDGKTKGDDTVATNRISFYEGGSVG